MTPILLTISAACLFDEASRLLLVRKRDTQAFMLPGGKAEPGEDALAALDRSHAPRGNAALDARRPPTALRTLSPAATRSVTGQAPTQSVGAINPAKLGAAIKRAR